MRCILVNWMSDVTEMYGFSQSTLHLSVNIADRYASKQYIPKCHYQCVGVASLLIATKIEEVDPLEAQDCSSVTSNTYSAKEILNMESRIAKTLQWNFFVPTAWSYFYPLIGTANATTQQRNTGQYYLEHVLSKYVFLDYKPSVLASSCVMLALNAIWMGHLQANLRPLSATEMVGTRCLIFIQPLF